MKYLLPVLALALMGCIRRPDTVIDVAPGTPPPSPARVAACEKTRTWHNAWVIAGTVLGGVAGAQGSVDTVVTNKTAQTGIDIGAAASGILAGAAAAAAGVEADVYSTENCNTVLQQAYSTSVASPEPPPANP